MFIEGIGFSGYRSFGPSMQYLGPCRKVNLFIGANNTGKYNTLRFLHDYCGGAIASIWDNNRTVNPQFLDWLLHFSTTIAIRSQSYRLSEKRKAGVFTGLAQPHQEA
jgi:hypothetical protein